MNDVVDKILKNCSSEEGISLNDRPDGRELTLNSDSGTGREKFFALFPGITLGFIRIDSRTWPESGKNASLKLLRIHYCVSGKIELMLDHDTYIYLKENDFCISEQAPTHEFFLPTGHYEGIALYIDPALLEASDHQILDAFDLEPALLSKRYCQKRKTSILDAGRELDSVLKRLWQFFDEPCVFSMKLCVLELIHILLKDAPCQSRPCAYYTELQVEIAKKTEQLLTADLKRHIPIRLIAEQFSVSQTSLKNYFQGVYGQNISTYVRTLRMNTAARLLTETSEPISEIAVSTGYTNQGKFAAVFRKHFQMSPLEYRRSKRLQSIS